MKNKYIRWNVQWADDGVLAVNLVDQDDTCEFEYVCDGSYEDRYDHSHSVWHHDVDVYASSEERTKELVDQWIKINNFSKNS